MADGMTTTQKYLALDDDLSPFELYEAGIIEGLRMAEKIAQDITTIELHVRVGVGDELKTYTVIVPRIGPLKVCDGIHIKTLRSAAQAIRAEREKLEKGV